MSVASGSRWTSCSWSWWSAGRSGSASSTRRCGSGSRRRATTSASTSSSGRSSRSSPRRTRSRTTAGSSRRRSRRSSSRGTFDKAARALLLRASAAQTSSFRQSATPATTECRRCTSARRRSRSASSRARRLWACCCSTTGRRSTTSATRSRSLIRTAPTRWVRRHRHPRRRLRRRARASRPTSTFAGRFTTSPSASDHARLTSGDHQEHPGQQAPRPRAGLRLLLGEQHRTTTRSAGPCATSSCTVISQSFHRNTEPGGSGLPGRRSVARTGWPCAGRTRRSSGGRQLLVGDPDNIIATRGRVRQSQGLQLARDRQPRRHRRRDVRRSVFRNPTIDARRPRTPRTRRQRHRRVGADGQTMSGTSFAAPADRRRRPPCCRTCDGVL